MLDFKHKMLGSIIINIVDLCYYFSISVYTFYENKILFVCTTCSVYLFCVDLLTKADPGGVLRGPWPLHKFETPFFI